jgi:HD-GYP domain-containing protein (c-di-GMP phosphodiesterase class II)
MNSENTNYCKNLIEVNKTNSVITNQAIYNDQGILLLAAGADLNEKRAEILLQHKLMKPLEQCVGISSSLDAKKLYDFLNKFASNIPGLKAVTNRDEYQHCLRKMCLFYEKYPLLQQNLTVLALRAAGTYHQSLFSALAGLAIAIQLKLSNRDLETVFIAGLFHDVGFLYLAPELNSKTSEFTQDEWKALQAHPLIARRFLDLVPELPKEIGIAIANHHERIDGTGYPSHIFGDMLPMVSQIIAATDNIIFNHMRYRDYGEHAHSMLLYALKFSDNIYFESVYDAAMVLFKYAPSPTAKLIRAPSVQELLARQKMLRQQFENAKALSQKLMQLPPSPMTRSISAAMGRLAISIVRSGILQPEQEQWLARFTLEEDVEDSFSLVEISVMLDQIYDQLLHLKNIMERAVECIPKDEVPLKTFAENALNQINFQEASLV